MCKAANVTGCRRNDLLISGSCFLLVFSLLQISALCQTIGGKLSPWLAVTALDVGHGDAFFLQLPGGVQMLVDAGGESDFNPQDWIGRTVVGAYLVSANCTRLDTVIVSHWHSDHFGGLIPVLAQISADSLVSPAGMWPPVIPALDLPSRLVAARRGLGFSQHSCSGVILYPTVCPDVLTNPNSASIIFRLEYASFSMIFTGDIPDKEQKQLAKAQEGRSVVLKVPHHGGHSLNAAWLTEVMPAYAVISGAGTSRGQPNQNTLGKLKKANVRLFCTDTIGNLCLRTDGTDLYVATTAGKANQSLWAANFFAIVLTLL